MEFHFSPPSAKKQRIFFPYLGYFHLRLITAGDELLCLNSGRLYTVGRRRRHCEIVFSDPCVSRYHCQIVLDESERKLRLFDGFLSSGASKYRRVSVGGQADGLGPRVCRNGVFVNGQRVQNGSFVELNVGDEVSLCCGSNGFNRCCGRRIGFVVERIAFSLDVFRDSCRNLSGRIGGLEGRVDFLLGQVRSILSTPDPVGYLRSSLELDRKCMSCLPTRGSEKNELLEAAQNGGRPQEINSGEAGHGVYDNKHSLISSVVNLEESSHKIHQNKEEEDGCYSDGRKFFLNRLHFMSSNASDQSAGVTLRELLYPIDSLARIFIATFTCDVSWFLTSCQIPQNLPVTIACHNRERCWSSSHESRSSAPYANYPNLLLVYPRFPDVIAFGKDPKKQGVACHHPKLFLLQRKGSMRVIVTSANLNSKQWDNITNTVWWQDFPRTVAPDYAALFGTHVHVKSDFAAQLAGFIASLIADVHSQAQWISDIAKHDFREAACHLVASVPGIYVQNSKNIQAEFCLSAKQTLKSKLTTEDFLGTIHSSVVGLNHRFNVATDPNGTQLKVLASLLEKCHQYANGTIEVLLKRNMDIPADANAVSIIVADLDKYSDCDRDYVQLGFLPRDVVKWLSPLSDAGFFSFSAFIYPKEALTAAFGGNNTRVQLLLYVSQGPKFSEMSGLIRNEHHLPLCSLVASVQRCLGLWRLEEVLSRFKWPESLETDFMYGSSSIGSSICSQFLSTFSSAAGKKSCQFADSEESDPEWGCWTASNERKQPSMRILFPTIDRVKNGNCGVEHYRCLLSLREKTWQRLRTTNIFHDAVPHPCSRVGYPMHVKVAQRSFRCEANKSSFGWIYCGSHNFSPAAWGQIILPTSEHEVSRGSAAASLGAQLRICNYELGIILIVPPPDSKGNVANGLNLDDFALPFVIPAPEYKMTDRPATAQAMREALEECAFLGTALGEELDEDIPDEEDELLEDEYFAEDKEEDKIYAEMLWSQLDSTQE